MSIIEMEKELEVCSRCRGEHPNLDCMFKDINKKDNDKCSRCGGDHFDLTCVYFTKGQDNQESGKT
jgi:hypothetical protein